MKVKLLSSLIGVVLLFACEHNNEICIKPQQPSNPEEQILDTKDIIDIEIENKVMATIGSSNWNGIIYANGKYIAVGDKGSIAYSTDGVNWTMKKIDDENVWWHGVTYGNGKFVTIGEITDSITEYKSSIAYSTDGINWTTDVVRAAPLQSIVYGDGKYIAVGENACMARTYNLSNWTIQNIGGENFSGIWLDVAYKQGSGFIAVGVNGHVVYSNNGVDWEDPIRLKNGNISVSETLNGVCIIP